YKKSILDLVLKRSDDRAKSIADRIADVSSLVNVGARYHKDCSKQFYSKKWSDEIRHDERKNNIDNAMEDVFAYLHENSEECQFRLADLMKSIEGDYIPEKRTVIERLKAKYKDDIVIFNEGKQDFIICFKGFIYKVISKRSSHKKNYPKEEKVQKVRDAAAIILEDIRSRHYETNQYPPSDNFFKEVNSLIPESLSVLLSGIICQSKQEERDFLDDVINDIDRTNVLQSINNPLFKKISSKFEESLTMLESKGPTATLWIQYYS
ncbi:hypothetical protein JTB14_037286, partial [Gonioctena quinquepunctata]